MDGLETFTDKNTGFAGWRIRIEPRRPVPTPAVAAGRLFVGGGFGSYDFYAFDMRSGAAAWHIHTSDDGPTAAVVADGCVIFNTESCTLEVVEAASGEMVWEKWLGDPLLAQPAVMDLSEHRQFSRVCPRPGKCQASGGGKTFGRNVGEPDLAFPGVAAGSC